MWPAAVSSLREVKLNKAVGSLVPSFITADLALDTAALQHCSTELHLDTTIECSGTNRYSLEEIASFL